MHAPSQALSPTIRDHFLADHRRLEDLFERVLDAFENGVREELSALWTRFETDLGHHMEAEEKFLIPAFAREYPEEAEAILGEHREFRCKLAELGVGVDLHIVRLTVASKFIEALRAHAHREDGLLYQWGDENLELRERASLLRALRQRIVPSEFQKSS
ncbi:MAG: hemerythrin domain-containing protein [Polyangiaceae bacterium]